VKLSPARAVLAALACLACGAGFGWFLGRASSAAGDGATEPSPGAEAPPSKSVPPTGSSDRGLTAEAPVEAVTDRVIPIELNVLPSDLVGLVLEVQASQFKAPTHPRGNCKYELNAELLNRTGSSLGFFMEMLCFDNHVEG
jgi:hypothetical protein